MIGLSDLMTLFYLPGVFMLQTDAKSIHCFQKKKRLKIGSVDQKLFKFQLTRVWELLTMPGTERDIAFSQLAVKGLRTCFSLKQ
jgi:hypothetical protein